MHTRLATSMLYTWDSYVIRFRGVGKMVGIDIESKCILETVQISLV